MPSRKPAALSIDYRTEQVPEWVREVIDTHLAIEAEDAQRAGALGFMARAMVLACLPYRDQKNADGTPKESFTRQNGDFSLRIVAGYEGGIPFGIYPRLLMSWVTTEAVRKKSPVIELGDTLRDFLRDVLDLRSDGGGARGSSTRVSEQMKRLFGSLITAQYSGKLENRGFRLRNVLIAEEANVAEKDLALLDALRDTGDAENACKLWTPQEPFEAGQWKSHVRLTSRFFQECVTNPVPIDLRAYKSLREFPLAMDLYTWLTYRMSYTTRRTRPIRWESLFGQFGSGFDTTNFSQAVRDFRKAFLRALKVVQVVYPQVNLEFHENGLVLLPSRPHVLPASRQPELF